MRRKDNQGKHENGTDIRAVETKLSEYLMPVTPRDDFVLKLKEKLAHQISLLPYLSRFSRSYVILMSVLLFVLGLAVSLLYLRAMITLLGVLSLYQGHQNQLKTE